VLLALAGLIAARRDVGTGLLPARDSAEPRLRLLSSPTALAVRDELGSIAVWTGATGLFAAVVGILSTSFTTANLPANLRQELQSESPPPLPSRPPHAAWIPHRAAPESNPLLLSAPANPGCDGRSGCR